MMARLWNAVFAALLLGSWLGAAPVAACGGFFCTTVPVDQSAERIIFQMDPGKVTTWVQINYVGAAEDFAWVLPMPTVPEIATAQSSTFRDLDRLTAPVFIAPQPPPCLRRPMPLAAPASAARAGEGVNVLASGEVGPFGYHVVASPDPQELVTWLRDNGYRIEPEMEPLVKVYTDEGMVFLAMKLKQGQNASDIVPVKLTYSASLPSIPIRLTAVAATIDMPVMVWVFANGQAKPVNYVPITVADSEIGFTPFGRNNYRQVLSRALDQAGGRAFITEFAGTTVSMRPPSDESLRLLMQQYPYLTRLLTLISPEEMTVDPLFELDASLRDVSNVHDLSNGRPPWRCDDDPFTFRTVADAGPPPDLMGIGRTVQGLTHGGGPKAAALIVLVVGSLLGFTMLSRVRVRLARGRSWLPAMSGLGAALLFAETVILQGVHELEHVAQLYQRLALGKSSASGLLGSVFDVEPVHMVYNAAFLLLLGILFAACRRDRSLVPSNAGRVLALLGVATVAQGYHTVEHVVKMWQYIQWGVNGTPGIVGWWVPVIYLHFAYNTLIYVPVVAAFVIGGFHRPIVATVSCRLARRPAPLAVAPAE
jgi:hypothetical protein